LNKGVVLVLIIICVAVFGYSAYQLISYYGADRAAEKDFSELLPDEVDEGLSSYETMLPYYMKLREQNGDMVGWLRIPKTRISYPVMQTIENPEYYLDKDFKKQFTASGSLFAASISDVDLPSDVVIIYGHRMKTGAMFGTLGKYLEPGFLEEHQKIIFDTFACRNEYKVYCAFSLAVNTGNEFAYYTYNELQNEEVFDHFVEQVRLLAEVEYPANRPVYGDKVLLLSTCEYTHTDGRLVLVAVRE